MEKIVDNCLVTMFICMTVLVCLGTIWAIWHLVIKPIIDHAKETRDDYWKRMYYAEKETVEKYWNYMNKIGLPPSTIEAIIPGTVKHMTSHEACADWEERCMLTFTVDTTELHKDFYGGVGCQK